MFPCYIPDPTTIRIGNITDTTVAVIWSGLGLGEWGIELGGLSSHLSAWTLLSLCFLSGLVNCIMLTQRDALFLGFEAKQCFFFIVNRNVYQGSNETWFLLCSCLLVEMFLWKLNLQLPFNPSKLPLWIWVNSEAFKRYLWRNAPMFSMFGTCLSLRWACLFLFLAFKCEGRSSSERFPGDLSEAATHF